MEYVAHSGGYNIGEPITFGHFIRENGLKIIIITVVFAFITAALAHIISTKSLSLQRSKKEEKHDEQ